MVAFTWLTLSVLFILRCVCVCVELHSQRWRKIWTESSAQMGVFFEKGKEGILVMWTFWDLGANSQALSWFLFFLTTGTVVPLGLCLHLAAKSRLLRGRNKEIKKCKRKFFFKMKKKEIVSQPWSKDHVSRTLSIKICIILLWSSTFFSLSRVEQEGRTKLADMVKMDWRWDHQLSSMPLPSAANSNPRCTYHSVQRLSTSKYNTHVLHRISM